ncbi:MAG: hypothetical protein WC841_02240 [Candidatus Shapirobacteria bacterium]|jgi:hypothetical protein
MDKRETTQSPSDETSTFDNKQYSVIKTGVPLTVDKGLYGKGYNYTVDFDSSPTLQALYLQAETFFRTDSLSPPQTVLNKLKGIVATAFPHQGINKVIDFERQLRKSKNPASLEDYAKNGIGNCSQTTLTLILLFEKLREKGMAQGAFTLEEADWENEFTGGGHTWAKYLPEQGEPVVVDVVRDYVGNEEGHKSILETVRWETLSGY